MMTADCCRWDFASNAGSLSVSASFAAGDYPMSRWSFRRWRSAPSDCCCWTNSSRDKWNLFRDYTSTSEAESAPNLRLDERREEMKINRKSFRKNVRLEKLSFLLQIGLELIFHYRDASRCWSKTTVRASLMSFSLFLKFSSRSIVGLALLLLSWAFMSRAMFALSGVAKWAFPYKAL